MTPEENLRECEQRYNDMIDSVILGGRPVGFDVRYLMDEVHRRLKVVDEYRKAMLAYAAVCASWEVAEDYRKKASEIAGHFAFFYETLSGHWQRQHGDSDRVVMPTEPVLDLESVASRAAALGLQFIDLDRTDIDPDAAHRIPAELARRGNLIPVKCDTSTTPNKLLVAVGDIQSSMAGLDEVRLVSRCHITPVLADPAAIRAAIERVYGGQ